MDSSSEFLAPELPFAVNDKEEDERVYYGNLVVDIAPKEGKATTLLADQLFSPSLLLAERIERGLIPLAHKTVLELGAGCALPSLLAATFSPSSPSTPPPKLVLATDYPSTVIMDTLHNNIQRNIHVVREGCVLACERFEWGNEEDFKRVKKWLHNDALAMSGEHGEKNSKGNHKNDGEPKYNGSHADEKFNSDVSDDTVAVYNSTSNDDESSLRRPDSGPSGALRPQSEPHRSLGFDNQVYGSSSKRNSCDFVAGGFDVLILSDLLYFSSSRSELVISVIALLKKDDGSRVYVAAGNYTARAVCDAFLAECTANGIEWEEGDVSAEWLGKLHVRGLTKNDMGARKGKCWWWVGRWGTSGIIFARRGMNGAQK